MTEETTAQPMSAPQLRAEAQKLSAAALKALESIMAGEGQDSVRLAAAGEVLDRGYGRPKPGGAEDESDPLTVVIRQFTPPPEREDAP